MGILAAAAVLAAAGFIELLRTRRAPWLWSAAGLILAVAAVVGHPRLGANVGGLITVTATALIFLHLVGHAKFSVGAVLPKLAVFVLFILAVLRLSLSKGDGTAHAGKAMAVIQEKGGSAILDIIARKLDMNIRGTFSYNTVVVVLMILLLFGLMKALGIERSRWLGWLGREFGALSRGFVVLFWAAFVAYAVNDTGAVAAQSILTYVAIPLFYLALGPSFTDGPVSEIEEAASIPSKS
jgi:hypothetical protein